MREIRQSGSEGGEEFKPLSLPLSINIQIVSGMISKLAYHSERSPEVKRSAYFRAESRNLNIECLFDGLS